MNTTTRGAVDLNVEIEFISFIVKMGALLPSYAAKWKFRFYLVAFNGGARNGNGNAWPRFYVADRNLRRGRKPRTFSAIYWARAENDVGPSISRRLFIAVGLSESSQRRNKAIKTAQRHIRCATYCLMTRPLSGRIYVRIRTVISRNVMETLHF